MTWSLDKKCISCGACVGVCPFMALELTNHGPECDAKLCTLCGTCERVCPVKAITVTRP